MAGADGARRCVRGQRTLGASPLARDICGPPFNFPESLVVVCGIYTRIRFDDSAFYIAPHLFWQQISKRSISVSQTVTALGG